MKRGKPLERRTPLARGKGLKRASRINPRRKADRRGRLALRGEARQALRLAAYERAGGRCEAGVAEGCPGTVAVEAFEWHHRKLRSQGGDDVIANSLCVCHACHQWIHEHPAASRAFGWIVPRVADPAARPVTLADGRIVRLGDDNAYDLIFTAEGDAAA